MLDMKFIFLYGAEILLQILGKDLEKKLDASSNIATWGYYASLYKAHNRRGDMPPQSAPPGVGDDPDKRLQLFGHFTCCEGDQSTPRPCDQWSPTLLKVLEKTTWTPLPHMDKSIGSLPAPSELWVAHYLNRNGWLNVVATATLQQGAPLRWCWIGEC